jgi:hypothetical protein
VGVIMIRLSKLMLLLSMLCISLSNLNAGYKWLVQESFRQAVFLEGQYFKLKEKYGTQDETKETDPDKYYMLMHDWQKADPFVSKLVSKVLHEQNITKPVVVLQNNNLGFFLNAGYFQSPRTSQDYIIVGANPDLIELLKQTDSLSKKINNLNKKMLLKKEEELKQNFVKEIERQHYYSVYHELGHMIHGHQSPQKKSIDLALFTTYLGSSVFLGKISKDFVKKYITKIRGTGIGSWLIGSYIPLRVGNLINAYRSRRNEKDADAFANMKLIESGHLDVIYQEILENGDMTTHSKKNDSLFNMSTHPESLERAKNSLIMLQKYGIDIYDASLLPKDWTKDQKKQYLEQLDKMSEFKKEERIEKS